MGRWGDKTKCCRRKHDTTNDTNKAANLLLPPPSDRVWSRSAGNLRNRTQEIIFGASFPFVIRLLFLESRVVAASFVSAGSTFYEFKS